jgi:DNA-binding response OmpR family regulator
VFTERHLDVAAHKRAQWSQAGGSRVAENNIGRTILICEDDPMVSVFLEDVLKTAGHHVISAHDGETAIRMAVDMKPAAITLDLDMPGLYGWEVMGRLKADPATSRIPIIIISAHPAWLTFIDRRQAAAVLEKPCPPWELRAAVEQALGEDEVAG